MTQSDTEEIRNIFHGYDIIEFEVYRPYKKSYINELIIKNY